MAYPAVFSSAHLLVYRPRNFRRKPPLLCLWYQFGDAPSQPACKPSTSIWRVPSPSKYFLQAPTVHANFRFFEVVSTHPETGKEHTEWWFGGGADLTPNYLYEEDAVHFHSAMKAGCDAGGKDDFYPRFKAWCDKYFFIKHRDECRGVGGVFFDDMDSSEGTQADMFNFVRTVGVSVGLCSAANATQHAIDSAEPFCASLPSHFEKAHALAVHTRGSGLETSPRRAVHRVQPCARPRNKIWPCYAWSPH